MNAVYHVHTVNQILWCITPASWRWISLNDDFFYWRFPFQFLKICWGATSFYLFSNDNVRFNERNDCSKSALNPTRPALEIPAYQMIMQRKKLKSWCNVCTQRDLINECSSSLTQQKRVQVQSWRMCCGPLSLLVIFVSGYLENGRRVSIQIWRNSILHWTLTLLHSTSPETRSRKAHTWQKESPELSSTYCFKKLNFFCLIQPE